MTRFFYDTEFLEDGRIIELISIGIVTEHGDRYYAINGAMSRTSIALHPWLSENVLPYLPRNDRGELDLLHPDVKARSTIAAEIESFIIEHGSDYRRGNELWAYYGAYDHVTLCQLWGRMIDLPRCVPMFTNDLMQLWQLAGRPEKPSKGNEHHALADAEWNLELYKACREALIARELDLDPDGSVWQR